MSSKNIVFMIAVNAEDKKEYKYSIKVNDFNQTYIVLGLQIKQPSKQNIVNAVLVK